MDTKLANISSTPSFNAAVRVGFVIFEVTPRLMQAQADIASDPPYLEVPVFFCLIYDTLKHVNGPYVLSLLSEFPGRLARRDNNSSVYIEAAFFVLVLYFELLQVSWSYIWLALFPAISIGFIVSLWSRLNLQNGSQSQQCDEGEASAGDRLGISGEEIKKAEEEQEHDEGGEASAGRGGDHLGAGTGGIGKETTKAEAEQEFVTAVPYWMFYILRLSQRAADTIAVSLFLLFLSFTLGAVAQMMARLALSGAAPGGAPASALLRKASLVALLVAAHAVAVELLGEQAVLFVLPEIAPLLLWLSVHVDRAGEAGPVITAGQIAVSRNRVSAVAAVVLACLAATMDAESIFSWVAKAAVSCGVSGLLVLYIVSMISQWRHQEQADGSKASSLLLEETAELLWVWAKVLLITATALLLPTSMAALGLGLHQQMLAAPGEFFNKYVASTFAL